MPQPLDMTPHAPAESIPHSATTAWKVINVLVLVVVLAANGAAGSGAMSGESIGTIANRYRSDFLPANYVFGIWSLIYLGLTVFTVYQALPNASATRVARLMGPWWLVSGVLNIAWVSAFSFARFGLAMLVMAAFLVVLVVIMARLRPLAAERSLASRLCVVWPFDTYLAWISVALIANSFQYAHVIGWGGWGIAESTWSVTMMLVATVLGVAMAYTHGVWVFPLVVAWALRGIGARYADVAQLHGAAQLLVPVGVVAGVVAVWWRGRRAGAVPRS